MGATAPLKVSWSRFDNETEKKTPLSDATSFAIPKEAFNHQDTAYYAADVSPDGDTRRMITVYVRAQGQGQPQVVGIDRSWSSGDRVKQHP